MIEIRGLVKRFGRLEVLREVDASIAGGRVTAIVGPNGAGKTTLIKCLLGLTRPDGGEILISGERVGPDPSYRAAIGYMPQLPRFPDNLTGSELLAFLRDLRGGVEQPVDEELIARFGLGGELGKPLRTLSGGTKQRVNAALAFLFAPRVLILDEPTAGLDPISTGVLKEKILAERDAGRTIVLTSHLMGELEELADDVLFLLDGRSRFAGSLLELKRETKELNLERAVARIMREREAA
jgi:Cu-processing system ATP-binding protein